MNRTQEFEVKADRMRSLIARNDLGGIILRGRDNFAWYGCGALSYISAAQATGVGSLLITADKNYLVADNIEADRFMAEELAGLPFEKVDYPWHDPAAHMTAVRDLTGGGKLGFDQGDGDVDLSAPIAAKRNPLTPSEIDRYRAHGKATRELTEAICRAIKPGMDEYEVAAMVHERFEAINARVPVCLIAADDRIETRRHPIPIGRKIEKRVMVVVCADLGGLWTNLTRLVNFEPLDGELKIKHRAVCHVDAAANIATTPGRALSDIFADIVSAYAEQGFGEQWQLHHQGGSTGYNGRDAFANPTCDAVVGVNQAFAWNPSITGTKSEDTMLVTDNGFEWLTCPGDDWPTVEVERDGVTVRRADILVA
jgi:Xaa-Pro aminopeptidase